MPVLNIPFAHAGMRLADLERTRPDGITAAEDERVMIDAQRYSLQNGYLVPFYEPQEQDLNRRNEELVVDRAQRFFDESEKQINIRLTRAELEHEIYEYETCPIAELHKIKARFLTGAMVNRMARLERAILQRNIEGIPLEIHPESGTSALSDAEVKACKDEFSHYYMYLIADVSNDPIRYVRLNDFSTDHDGILLDLVREMGKPLAMPEPMLRGSILTKIGRTMEAIDETHDQITQLLDNPQVAKAIDRAYIKAMPTVYTDDDEEDRTRGSVRYRRMFEELTSYCRARAGLKTEDRSNFGAVRERITYIDSQLHEVHKQVGELRRLKGQSTTDVVDIERMLREGTHLMQGMAELRLPKNHNALDIYEQKKDGDMSSVGRLATKVDQWLERHAATPDLPG